jgi:hypothetical protein
MTDKITPADTPPQPFAPSASNGLAIASLILGIVSFLGFGLLTGIPAIITGVIALKKQQQERGISIAGIILGSISTLLSILFILFLVLLFILGAVFSSPSDTNPAPMNGGPTIESSRT